MGKFILTVLTVITLGYFLPATVASYRRNPNTAAILVLNLFLGWTLIGWVLAFVWALVNQRA